MISNRYKEIAKKVKRHHVKMVAFGLLGMLAGAGLAVLLSYGQVAFKEYDSTEETVIEDQQSEVEVATTSEAVRLYVKEAGIDAVFEEPLGLNNDRTIEVPESYETVAYYKFGPKPGEVGPAVVLGHVDSYRGPAVFYRLGQLEVGDEIFIEKSDGSKDVFIVESLERHSQDGFPTEKVYSDLDYPGLRLITCTGTYDHDTLRYSHNLIVFAKKVE